MPAKLPRNGTFLSPIEAHPAGGVRGAAQVMHAGVRNGVNRIKKPEFVSFI
jgi:hypothetical protein